MSHPTAPAPAGEDSRVRTRRAVLAGGVAGAIGATVLGASAADAQDPPDPRYVLRDRMPINVKDQTAGGSDDTTQVQNAIDAAAAGGGGTVYFPPGDYVVNGGLVIPPTVPIRLLGAGMVLGPLSTSNRPTRLVRNSGSNPIVRAGSDTSDAFDPAKSFSLEISDMQLRASTSGRTADFTSCNPVNLHNVSIGGGDGVRLRQVFNSNGSGLYFHGMGTSTSPAVLFDALPTVQGGCATFHWTDVEFEGNGGIDLMMDGYTSGTTNAPTVDVRITNWKAEGGSGGPHVKLGYAQGITLDDGAVSFHGRGSTPALVVDHPYATSSITTKLPCLEIVYSGSDAPQDAIQIVKGGLDVGMLNVLRAPSGPTRSAIRVESGANADALRCGQLRQNVGSAISDARSSAQYTDGVEVKPKLRAYRNTAQAITSGVFTAVAFNGADKTDAGTATEQHSTSTNNTRLTCRAAGFYALVGEVELGASAGGTQRAAAILLNGTTAIGGWAKSPPLGAGLTVNLAVSTMYQLAVGDYVELFVYHDAGVALNVNSPAGTYSPELSMAYLTA